jgi:hypothetical protein
MRGWPLWSRDHGVSQGDWGGEGKQGGGEDDTKGLFHGILLIFGAKVRTLSVDLFFDFAKAENEVKL